MWTELFAVMKKELRQAFRDKRMAVMLLVAPVLQLTVLGYSVDLEVDHIPTVVCDQDRTAASRELASAFLASRTFERTGETLDCEAASHMLERGEAAVAPDTLMDPASIAATYWHLHRQGRDAWTHELDLRPYGERW